MNILKLLTTRNAFSREYGTWLIVLFNIILSPVLIGDINRSAILFSISIILFLAFRFELLDLYSLNLQGERRTAKIKISSIYLILAALSYMFFLYVQRQNIFILLIPLAFILLILNIATRRKKGKRQPISAQLILMLFIGIIPSINYFLISGYIDKLFWFVGFCCAVFYSNSVIYVRSKTKGSPYDIYAVLFTLTLYFVFLVLNWLSLLSASVFLLFLPTLIKGLDNIILSNFKVPLRRIGLYETFHSILFIILFKVLYS